MKRLIATTALLTMFASLASASTLDSELKCVRTALTKTMFQGQPASDDAVIYASPLETVLYQIDRSYDQRTCRPFWPALAKNAHLQGGDAAANYCASLAQSKLSSIRCLALSIWSSRAQKK